VRAEVEPLLEQLAAWAARRPDVHGLAVVGSYAGGGEGSGSDVDLVLVTEDVESYILDDGWARELGLGPVLATRRWGAVTERRLRLPSGLELDVAIAPPAWASTKRVDGGTRRVVAGGMRILHDPRGKLAALAAAVSLSR
jgi:predicted nucleotidyltransferase